MELLAAVTMIGILAAAAAPSFVQLMRDKRVASAAVAFADVFRLARSRAMGRGSAVLVRWNASAALPTQANPSGHLTMREAVQGTGGDCAPTPSTSCLTTDWADGSPTSQFVTRFDERAPLYAPATAQFVDQAGNGVDYAEVCFTPRGRSFIRFAAAGVFGPMTGVPRLEVRNAFTSYARQVTIPPNGAARVVTTVTP